MLADMSDTDLNLLARYTRHHAEDAFAELVRRHLGLVYSAALRQVRSPQLAEEVTQSAFIDLARSAARLKPDTILTAWLYQVTRRTAIDVVRREASRQLREQIATEMNAMNATAADWTHIEPLLDEAMHALDDTDRAAVLLRYFENKSLREVGATLGTSENAAQKRLGRAVERLREFFAKRGVTVGASGLVVVISANAVQAASVGLVATISTAAALAGTTFVTTTTATIGKAIAMTTMQKTLIAAALAAAVSTGIYEARQASTLRTQVKALQQQQTPLNEEIQQLALERDDSARQLVALRNENARLNGATAELLKLRNEGTNLRAAVRALMELKDNPRSDATAVALNSWVARVKEFKRLQDRMPDKTIPELRLLTEEDWLELAKEPLGHSAKDVNLEDDLGARLTLRAVRAKAKDKLMRVFSRALEGYAKANEGQLPTDTLQLKPFLMYSKFEGPARVVDIREDAVDETILGRYEMLQTGKIEDVPADLAILAEKAPVDNQYDTRLRVGRYWMGVSEMDTYSP
jgi:RNA polymerase sigma factor (sigma-70 family)